MKYLKSALFICLIFSKSLVFLCANPLDPTVRANTSAEDYYNMVVECFQKRAWGKLIWQAQMLEERFPYSPLAKEVHYHKGVALYEISEFAKANAALSDYLQEGMTPQFFEEAMRYKFEIACHFQEGHRRRLFHARYFPKWVLDYEKAIEIFDQVITTMPRSDLAALSLYRQGTLFLALKQYDKSLAAFHTFIRRFPKHILAPDSYLSIGKIYLTRCEKHYAASRYLDCAQLNLSKFRAHFPLEPRIEEAESQIIHIENVMADHLLEMGEFYKKTKKWKAASLYYRSILKKYPHARAAHVSEKHLSWLNLNKERSKSYPEEEQRS